VFSDRGDLPARYPSSGLVGIESRGAVKKIVEMIPAGRDGNEKVEKSSWGSESMKVCVLIPTPITSTNTSHDDYALLKT
jgi:hypothetical protein